MRTVVLASLAVASRGFSTIISSASKMSAVSGSHSRLFGSKVEKPYGSWESPITSKAITAGSVSLSALQIMEQQLYWLEGRPQEGGRSVLVQYAPDDPDKSARNAVDVTPPDSNARTRVHEYGGGAVTMGQESVFYSDFASQRVFQLSTHKKATAHAVSPPVENARFRFADGVYDEANQRLLLVREDHTLADPKDVVNQVISLRIANDDNESLDENGMTVLATGRDFYAAPRLSPDGTQLAYIAWNHPNMPWDATELRIRSITNDNDTNDDAADTSTHALVAGADQDTSILQPVWHPKTGDLYYISDQSGYYNIYRHKKNGDVGCCVLEMEYDFGGSAPGWALGQHGFCFLDDGRLCAHYKKDGHSRLVVANVVQDPNGPATQVQEYGMDDGLPMQFGGIVAGDKHDVFFIGGSPSAPTTIYRWNLEQRGPAVPLASSSTLSFPPEMISVPQQIEFPTTLGTAYGYYYPPCNGNFQCTDAEETPPLLVKAHGGPTACTGTSFNAGIQYWTSRGFAVLDVDYGGSTGYGREYRRRLRGSWGIVDIDDVCAGANYLVEQNLADPNRLCIDGGSAGGYTTLGALAFRNVFSAGCSLYGIGDLTALAGDTHKFESRYLDGLVGPYPQDEAVYKKRSPIESVDTLSCPILLLQGAEDKVVPPNQAIQMHAALLQKQIPTCLKIYENEQHGFRQAKNIEDALDSELAFYGRVFGIAIPNAIPLHIDNMPDVQS